MKIESIYICVCVCMCVFVWNVSDSLLIQWRFSIAYFDFLLYYKEVYCNFLKIYFCVILNISQTKLWIAMYLSYESFYT